MKRQQENISFCKQDEKYHLDFFKNQKSRFPLDPLSASLLVALTKLVPNHCTDFSSSLLFVPFHHPSREYPHTVMTLCLFKEMTARIFAQYLSIKTGDTCTPAQFSRGFLFLLSVELTSNVTTALSFQKKNPNFSFCEAHPDDFGLAPPTQKSPRVPDVPFWEFLPKTTRFEPKEGHKVIHWRGTKSLINFKGCGGDNEAQSISESCIKHAEA